MKNIYKVIAVILVLLASAQGAFTQKAFYFGPDATVNVSDSLVIRLNDYEGTIQWQKSLDLDDWQNIPGATRDTLLFVADTTSYFRAEVIAGDCDPFYSDTTKVDVYTLKEEVVLIDEDEMILVSDSTELEAGIYRFQGQTDTTVEPGSVILGQQGEGFMRRVLSVQQDGEELILTTGQANMEDIFESFLLQDSLVITLDQSKTFIHGGRPLPLEVIYLPPGARLKEEGSGIDFSGTVIFSDEITDDEGNTATITVGIEEGSIDFEPLIEREFDYRKFSGLPTRLNRMYLKAGGEIDANMIFYVQVTGEINYAHKIPLPLASFKVPVAAGPVPMTVKLNFSIGFNTHLEAELYARAGFTSNYQVGFGAEYNREADPQWEQIWEQVPKFNPTEPTFSYYGLFTAKVYIEPEIAMRITGIDGPKFSVDPYLRFLGELNYPQWYWELAAGIGGKLGFQVELFGYEVLDYNMDLFEWDNILASNTIDLGSGDGVTDIDGNFYPSVIIGNREWMAKNLRTRHFNNGDPILTGPVLSMAHDAIVHILDHNNIEGLHSDSDVLNAYGALYNSFALRDSRGICPTGWEVASLEDWGYLSDFVMAEYDLSNEPDDLEGLANALKSCRQVNSPLGGDCATNIHPRWNAHDYHFGTDMLEFGILPGGYVHFGGPTLPYSAHFSALSRLNDPEARRIISASPGSGSLVFSPYYPLPFGNSIRCVRLTEPPASKSRLDYQISPPEAAGKDLHSYHSLHEQVNVTLDPYRGYNFLYWKMGNSIISYEPDFTFTMPGHDAILTAHYEGDGIGWGPHCEGMPHITDTRDNTIYNTVQMGDQCWLKENMKYLPSVDPWVLYSGPFNPAYPTDYPYHIVWMYEGSDINEAKASEYYQAYGVLYSWWSAQDACPAGWRLPTHDDWTQMERWACQQLGNDNCEDTFPLDNTTQGALGSAESESRALKSCRNSTTEVGIECQTDEHPRWVGTTFGYNYSTDDFGFSAHAGGVFPNGSLPVGVGPGQTGGWWTGTVYSFDDNDNPLQVWYREMDHSGEGVIRYRQNISYGRSVRCIKDE